MSRRIQPFIVITVLALLAALVPASHAGPLDKIEHLVVIYQENWSFDGLYGSFPGANGIANAGPAATQLDDSGKPYEFLPVCTPCDKMPANLPNGPFELTFIKPNEMTRELIHEFFTNQYQINGGAMNKFVAASVRMKDAAGLVMSHYDATDFPEGKLAREFTLCDNFFQSAFGGSFLNHMFLIAARAPVWANAPADMLPKMDADGYITNKPKVNSLRFGVNTLLSVQAPHPTGFKADHAIPAQTFPTIGDRLSDKGVSWAWYAGGWRIALEGHGAENLFQFHHQPFAYFKNYAEGTPARTEHLRDEDDFRTDLAAGRLPAVSFIKPIGKNNEHPFYTDLMTGQLHVADLVAEIRASAAWPTTAIIIAYDENGGRWDHVAPPKRDAFGPGPRIPAIVISPFARKGYVDHTQYETVSILSLIEKRWGLEPLNQRDARANAMEGAFEPGE